MNETPWILKTEEYEIHWSRKALEELREVKNFDFTLEGKSLRLAVAGKGCAGFEYSLFFDTPLETDLKIPLPLLGDQEVLLLDAFIAQYFKRGEITYHEDAEGSGPVITNWDEENYHGKFWKRSGDPAMPGNSP